MLFRALLTLALVWPFLPSGAGQFPPFLENSTRDTFMTRLNQERAELAAGRKTLTFLGRTWKSGDLFR